MAHTMTQAAQLVDLLPALEAPVHGVRGEPLGHVVRLWCDPESGAIGNATLLLSKGSGQEPLHITIPWSQFRVTGDGRFELPLSRPVLLDVARSAANR